MFEAMDVYMFDTVTSKSFRASPPFTFFGNAHFVKRIERFHTRGTSSKFRIRKGFVFIINERLFWNVERARIEYQLHGSWTFKVAYLIINIYTGKINLKLKYTNPTECGTFFDLSDVVILLSRVKKLRRLYRKILVMFITYPVRISFINCVCFNSKYLKIYKKKVTTDHRAVGKESPEK